MASLPQIIGTHDLSANPRRLRIRGRLGRQHRMTPMQAVIADFMMMVDGRHGLAAAIILTKALRRRAAWASEWHAFHLEVEGSSLTVRANSGDDLQRSILQKFVEKMRKVLPATYFADRAMAIVNI